MWYYKRRKSINGMSKRQKSSRRKQKINPKLAALFKMSREQLNQRKTTGGGLHKTRKDKPRSEQKRKAINDQVD